MLWNYSHFILGADWANWNLKTGNEIHQKNVCGCCSYIFGICTGHNSYYILNYRVLNVPSVFSFFLGKLNISFTTITVVMYHPLFLGRNVKNFKMNISIFITGQKIIPTPVSHSHKWHCQIALSDQQSNTDR